MKRIGSSFALLVFRFRNKNTSRFCTRQMNLNQNKAEAFMEVTKKMQIYRLIYYS